jgi:hypothetical protein
MTIAARSKVAGLCWLIIAASVSIATTSSAQTPTKSLAHQLVGHWQLVAVTINGNTPYGANPQGSMFIDAGGHFSVVVISTGDARDIAYFGTYKVNDADSSVTMHIDGISGGGGINAAGRDEKRLISLNGDELTVRSETPSGAAGAVTLTWKQAN